MILTGENRSIRGKTCPSATLCTANLTWTDLESKTRLRGERPATNCLSQLNPRVFIKIRFLPPSKHTASPLQTPIMAAYCGSHTTEREREWSSGGLVTGAGRQTAWKRNLPLCDTADGIVCVWCPGNKCYIQFLML